MRWKEHHFVNIGIDCGFTIAYVCFSCSNGSINGFYFNSNSRAFGGSSDSGNPNEPDFCFWLLLPEPSSRPTTRETRRQLLCGIDSVLVSILYQLEKVIPWFYFILILCWCLFIEEIVFLVSLFDIHCLTFIV